jgi:hypothetical protein
MRWLLNNLQIIVLLLVLGASGLHWILNKLKEQAAIKRAQTERARREEEMLRTGRVMPYEEAQQPGRAQAPVTPAEARERLAEIARRRQAQLEQARRESQRTIPPPAPARAPARGGASGPPPIIVMGPSGPIVVPRPQQRPAPASPRPAPAPAASRQPRPQRPPPPPKQRARPPEPAREPAPVEETAPRRAGDESIGRPRPDMPQPADRPRRVALAMPPVTPRNAAEYRRLLAMVEILSPPLALRGGPVDPGAVLLRPATW